MSYPTEVSVPALRLDPDVQVHGVSYRLTVGRNALLRKVEQALLTSSLDAEYKNEVWRWGHSVTWTCAGRWSMDRDDGTPVPSPERELSLPAAGFGRAWDRLWQVDHPHAEALICVTGP